MTLTDLILTTLSKASSQRPMPHAVIHRAVLSARPETTPDEVPDAIESLREQRLVATCRVTRGGIAQDVYWPTGLKRFTPPTLDDIRMAAEPKNSQLARLILLHGPISGPALAEKARETGMNCPAKNIHGLLASHVQRGEIIARKANGVTVYMTPTQAEDEASAHVMSAPPKTKQSGEETPVSETASPDDQAAIIRALQIDLAHRDRDIHQLKNDVAGANLVLQQLADRLQVDAIEQIPGAVDEIMQATATYVLHSNPLPGKQALVLIDSAELIEIEELAVDDDAQNRALSSIELGHAARVLVVRIMGEATRQAKWKEAA